MCSKCYKEAVAKNAIPAPVTAPAKKEETAPVAHAALAASGVAAPPAQRAVREKFGVGHFSMDAQRLLVVAFVTPVVATCAAAAWSRLAPPL